MLTATRLMCSLSLGSLLFLTGCSTTSSFFSSNEQCSEEGGCKTPSRWSEEWYAMQGDMPVGRRQVTKKGKVWPPFPRPEGKELPFWHKFHAAHYWPYPYTCQDRAFVNNLQEQQVSNGWVNATTLYDYHFEGDSQQLNHAGNVRLRWILNETPENRRVAFAQTGFTRDVSNMRLQNVQLAALEMVGEEHLPPIMLRTTTTSGRPAAEVDFIHRKYLETMPTPHLQSADSGNSDSSDSGIELSE